VVRRKLAPASVCLAVAYIAQVLRNGITELMRE